MKARLIFAFAFSTAFACWGQDTQQPQLATRPPASQPTSSVPTCTDADNRKPPSVAWTVLPERVVRDNYGHNVSHNYIAIDVTIHNNNCSTQLLVKSFAFASLKDEDPDSTLDPDLVKGSIAKGHEVGTRNRIVSGIKTFGLIGTGASGFFKAAGAAATYNRGLAIFSDPFEKGIELIFPDTTVTYLKNWDGNEVFKNGFAVLPRTSTRGRVFLPIAYVCEKLKADKKDCQASHNWKGPVYDPAAIKKSLGRIQPLGVEAEIAVGRPIAQSSGGVE